MTRRAIDLVDLEEVRHALQKLNRRDLLIIAERATELVPNAKFKSLLGDFVRLESPAGTTSRAAPLLKAVRKFHAASMQGEFYEGFAVNSKNYMETSEGTAMFSDEFNQLLQKCIDAAITAPLPAVREAFELLFGLLRHIDKGNDDVIFFADEGGSWAVGVDWSVALPAYFQCLANSASAEDFARDVDRAIKDFSEYDRPRHLIAARRVASNAQKAALRALSATRR